MTTTPPYLRAPIPRLDDLAELYHENTKVRAYQRDTTDDPTGAALAAELPPVASLVYADPSERLALPAPAPVTRALSDVIAARRSVRAFTGASLTLAEVSSLFAHTYGITGEDGARAAPSAGGRYPLELFLLARNVDGVATGVWHYRPESHELEPWPQKETWERASRALFQQPVLERASAILVVGAVFGRTQVKYGERGYRLILLDAGHAMQNALLAATGLGLGACPLGGFVDDELTDLVALDGMGENVLYCAALGRPE